ncbi:DUF2470 domain-containing protein [Endozoicomonas sp. Mp262]|uniref:HugZ family pyridoxamine 5'-phosphate oxidase n=1 Tax=Endozoicomonas sp. Mp262 TaxID=2919499 RepID=UPI0021D9B3CA
MERKEEAAFDARSLMLKEYSGILSTHSHDVPGYPFGSVMPYCLDKEGCPLILISRIAQHTKNIQENPRVSLIITESHVDDAHLGARLTWIGDAELIEDHSEIAKRYYSFFPQSQDYHKTHRFDFYRINLVRARYIGGFGKIFWIKNELLTKVNPFVGETETNMIKHMNEDHIDAMVKYCKAANIELPEGIEPRMAGINSEGIHLLIDRKLVFIRFSNEVQQPVEVRQQLVAMAKIA